MKKPVIAAAICAVLLQIGTPAMARQDNFNPNAGGNGNGNGASNANCNSALIFSCDDSPGVSGAPGPSLGLLGALGVIGTVFLAKRRNRKTD